MATSAGIDIVDPAGFKVTSLIRNTKNEGYHAEYHFKCVIEDHEGIIWAGSDNGLYSFIPISDSVNIYRQNNTDNRNLLSNRIDVLFEDDQGLIWIGTQAGISIYDKKNKKFKALTTRDGLPSANINNIIEDKAGMMWIGTDKGLTRYDITSNSITNYTIDDGLFSNQITPGVLMQGKNGMIYAVT